MRNFKLIKTAAALALGASVVTSAVVATDASAASKYKVKSGKLYVAKTGKLSKGYVTYKSVLYKNGKKLTGLKSGIYYKSGKKATGTYKGTYYVKGAKKVTTGTYNKAYYVKGVKKVSTGLYASKYYKDGKVATGTYKGAYYVNGVKKVTTGYYNKAYYVAGKKVATTGLYKDQLYVEGKLNQGYKLYKEDLYKDAVLNTELVLFEGKLYDGAKENKGIKKFEDKWYNDAELANGTFEIEGKEVAIEKGIEVGAKVASVEAVSATQIKVTFNKSVDAATLLTDVKVATGLVAGTVSVKEVDGTENAVKSAKVEGKTVTLNLTSTLSGEYVVQLDKLKTTGKEDIARYSHVVKFAADTVAPTIKNAEQVKAAKVKVNFSEALSTEGAVSYKTVEGKEVTGVTSTFTAGNDFIEFDLSAAQVNGTDLKAGEEVVVTFIGAKDMANNIMTPNPATIKIKKVEADKAAPTVSSVAQTGAKEVTVKFDKAVTEITDGKLTLVTVGSAHPTSVEKVSETEYKFGFKTALEGIQTVTIDKSIIKNIDEVIATEDFTKLVTFVKDVAAPKAVAQKVVTVDGKEYLQLTFDKDVELVGAKTVTLAGTQTVDYISTTVDSVDETVKYANVDKDSKPTDKKVVLVSLTNVTEKGAKYELTLANKTATNGIVSASDIAIEDTKVEFTRGEDVDIEKPAEPTKEVVESVAFAQGANNNEVKVTFTFKLGEKLDGASAVNIANYSIDGAEIESATLAAASDTKQIVTLKLKQNSNTFSGVRNASVKNVKIANSSEVMTEQKVFANLTENVLAQVKSAQITANNKITVTFSEKLNSINKESFIVKAGDQVITLDAAGTVLEETDKTKAVITLGAALTQEQLAKVITVESAKDEKGKVDAAKYVVTDSNDNVSADFAPITVVKP